MSDAGKSQARELEIGAAQAATLRSEAEQASAGAAMVPRAAIGGVLMGLANLVPGISGGTMLLAAGIYPRFIEAIAELSTLKFRKASLLLLGAVGIAALSAILLFATPVKDLVVHHRWIMYSLFIGLTLGGVPVVWRMASPAKASTWAGAAAGLLAMSALAIFQQQGAAGAATSAGWGLMFLAGVAGASAMILPGVSGGYLLLVLGVYVPVLGAIGAFKDALKAMDLGAAMTPAMQVLLPLGLGVLVGILAVSNLLKWLLVRYERSTLGVLLGLLVGAVVGLFPFQQGVAPAVGELFKGRVMTEALIAALSPDKYPTQFFEPTAMQVLAAVGIAGLGFGLTSLIARFGSNGEA